METRAPDGQLTLSKEKTPFHGQKLPSPAQLGIPSMCAADPNGDLRGGGGEVQCTTPAQLRRVLTAHGWLAAGWEMASV